MSEDIEFLAETSNLNNEFSSCIVMINEMY